MPGRDAIPRDAVEWAGWVNDRWIVHHGLKEAARDYLEKLQREDPERLRNACERARRLVKLCGPGRDPKPWFYAGLFSVATLEEATHYLEGRWFTASCIPAFADTLGKHMAPVGVGPEAQAKLKRIRAAVDELG